MPDVFPHLAAHGSVNGSPTPTLTRSSLLTGWNHSADDPDFAELSTFALKLTPERNLLLQGWFVPSAGRKATSESRTEANRTTPSKVPPKLVTVKTIHTALPNIWYHLVVRYDGVAVQLIVNGGSSHSSTILHVAHLQTYQTAPGSPLHTAQSLCRVLLEQVRLPFKGA